MAADLEPEVLEFDSFTESLLQTLSVGGGCASVFALGFMFAFRAEDLSHVGLPYWALGGLVVFAVASWLRSKVDMTLVLDPQREQVLYRRNLFGWVTLTPLAGFRDLQCVTEAGREVYQKGKPPYWESALFLVTRSGRKIRASNYEKSPKYPNAAKLAERLGVDHLTGGRTSYLVIRKGRAEHSADDGSNRIFGYLAWVLLGGFFISMALFEKGIVPF